MQVLPNVAYSSSYKEPKSKKRTRVKESIADYAENSTTHGISYVFERDVHYWSRLAWLITVIALVTLAIVMITSLYNAWMSSPITTTVDDPAVPIDKIDYPAITICGVGRLADLAEIAYSQQMREYLLSKAGISRENK